MKMLNDDHENLEVWKTWLLNVRKTKTIVLSAITSENIWECEMKGWGRVESFDSPLQFLIIIVKWFQNSFIRAERVWTYGRMSVREWVNACVCVSVRGVTSNSITINFQLKCCQLFINNRRNPIILMISLIIIIKHYYYY